MTALETNTAPAQGNEVLWLKWGTLKGWNNLGERSLAALNAYFDIGKHAAGAMQQRDNFDQLLALCEAVHRIDGVIQNDWTGEVMAPADACLYLVSYDHPGGPPALPNGYPTQAQINRLVELCASRSAALKLVAAAISLKAKGTQP